MKRWLKWIGLVLLAGVVGLALAFAYTAINQTSHGGTLTLDQAAEAARQAVAAYGNPDLALTEVMEFENNFYVEVIEQSSGIHAFELLVNRNTGVVSPEPGPNMMWNTRYGHMGGMMGGWSAGETGPMPETPEQALDITQRWLDRFMPSLSAAEEADAFYGYYTIHVMRNGQLYGMLSVNGYSGEVWYHNWHGDFIDMEEMEKSKE
jgi:hypothetical protein